MRHEFRLADIGEGLEEAEIITWLVAVGDHVTRDQPLIEIMTDKSNAELPAPEAGTVVELAGSVGDIIEVGALIAVIESHSAASPGEPDPVAMSPAPVTTDPAPTAALSPVPAAPGPAPQPAVSAASDVTEVPDIRVKAAPSTRRAAAERGIDLSRVVGTGPGGRVLMTDLDSPQLRNPAAAPLQITQPPQHQGTSPAPASAAEPPPPQVAQASPVPPSPSIAAQVSSGAGTVPLRGIRRAVARSMTQSWSEIPHIHVFEHIDAQPLLAVRERLRDTGRPSYERLTPLAFFVAAVARALRENPGANSSINMQDETITQHAHVNVGVAVASPQGLVVPVLRGADQLDFEALSVTLTQLVRDAREGQLGREHFVDGTVTITNFGALGGEQAAPLIRPPEAMIVGFGSIAERPFVIDGEVVARKTMHLVAGADHRLLDGDTTTAVLNTIASLLSDPLELVI